MADTLELNAGCGGALLAVDTISEGCPASCVNYQIIKPAFGALNTATLVTACAGLPVDIKASVAISVDDNCGALTVDGCVGITGTVTVDLGANNDVTIDNSSIVHAEDAVHCTGDAGVMSLAVRNDTLAALGGTDGDYAPLQVNASGALYIQEGSALDVSAAAVPVTDNCGALTVDGTVSICGTVSVDLGANNDVTIDCSAVVRAEDTGHSTGHTGIMALAVRNDCAVALAGTDLDYIPLSTNASGALRVTGGGGGTEYCEDAATPATITGTATLIERDDALSCVTPIEGDWIGLRGSARGALWVQLDTPCSIPVDDNCASLTVDNAGLTALCGAICGTEMQVDIVASLPAGTNAIGKLSANSGVDIGDVDVTSIAAGTNLIGDVGLQGRACGGLSVFRSIDLDESEEQVKGSGGRVYSIVAFNTTAAPLFLKMYNAPSACVTVGGCAATTPKETFVIPGHPCSDGSGFVFACPTGACYCAGITAAVTTGVADCDTGAPGANAAIVNIRFK